MKLNKFLVVVIFALFIALMFVQLGMGVQEATALPDNPSLKISITSSQTITYTPEDASITVKFTITNQRILSITGTIQLSYGFKEDLSDYTIKYIANETFGFQEAKDFQYTIPFTEPLYLPRGPMGKIQLAVREGNESGDIQDTDYFDVTMGTYYGFEIVDTIEIKANQGGDLLEDDLIDIDVTVRNTRP